MKSPLITFLFLAITTTCLAQDFSKVKSIINDQIDNNNVPSISIAVVKNGKILWEESFGFAEKEQQRKATIHTPYYLASISKTITATALVKLAEQKVIDLNGSVNHYMRHTKISSDMWDANTVTVKQVMSHTSGLTTYGAGCTTDSASCAANESNFINRYAVLVQPPGKAFDYSNLGYGVLDKVIRDVSGKTFAAYMKQEIFEPMNMKNTFVNDGSRKDQAASYSGFDNKRVQFNSSYSFTPGASTIYASVHDMALFAMMHLNSLKNKNSIISETSIALMQDTIARTGNGQHYGLGWWITDDYYGYKSLLAQGGTYFGSAWMMLVPSEEITVVVLTNIGHGDPWRKIINEVLSTLLPEFKANLTAAESAPKKQAAVSPPTTLPATKWKGIVRTYTGDIPLTFSLLESGGGVLNLGSDVITVPKISINPGRLSCNVEGDLHLDDIGPGPYILKFYLTLRDDLLYGHVETQGTMERPTTQQLSYWVKLKKVE